MKSPAFQFYPGDYLGSQRVQMLTLEEEGAYIRLLCYCWQHGSIPSDPDQIARLIGKGASTTLARVVQPFFKMVHGNRDRMTHERLDQERAKQAIWSAKSKKGGISSGIARKKTKGGSLLVEPNHEPNTNSSSPASAEEMKSRGVGRPAPHPLPNGNRTPPRTDGLTDFIPHPEGREIVKTPDGQDWHQNPHDWRHSL